MGGYLHRATFLVAEEAAEHSEEAPCQAARYKGTLQCSPQSCSDCDHVLQRGFTHVSTNYMTPYTITYTFRHAGRDLEIWTLDSETPFPAFSVGDFVHSGALPPTEPQTSRFTILEVIHSSQKLTNGVRHYIHLIIGPDDSASR